VSWKINCFVPVLPVTESSFGPLKIFSD
jgi:hypothetical protein